MTKNKEQVTRLEDVIREKAESLESELKKSLDKSVEIIKENPLLAILGAFAVGFIVAKASSRKRL
ncbi:MAG: hypothetical protein ABIR96_04420 [Bdellovibrionota bacterium]